MSIIVEGFDNAGKTTLVKHLASTFGLPVVVSAFDSRSKYEDRMYHVHLRFMNLLKTGVSFIGDRCSMVSEDVYGPPIRGVNDILKQSLFDEKKLWDDLFLHTRLFIYCRPSDERIMNFGDRDQMPGVIEQAQTLLDRYDDLMNALMDKGYPIHIYNFDEPNALNELEAIVKVKLCI